jgi:hypothetical protein
MVRLFYDLILYIYRFFLDNIAIKGLDIDYRGEKLSNYLEIYRYIIEYIKNLNDILYNTKLAKGAINAIKSK